MIKWVATFLVIWFIYHVRSVFPPFIIAAILAYLLLPVVNGLSGRLNINKRSAIAVIYLTAAAVIGICIWKFMPTVMDQFAELWKSRQDIIANLIRNADQTFQWNLDVEETSAQLVRSLEESYGKPQEIVHIGALVSHGLLETLVVVVSSIYFILDSNRIGDFFVRFVPVKNRATVINLSAQMNQMLSRYVRGQLVLILIMSTVAWVFLHYVIHMNYALPIAILSGTLEIIPVLGPIVATTIATLVGFSQYGIYSAGMIIIFYTAARWLEDYLVVPKVIGHAVHLHPLIVIAAVLCGEVMAGGLGMLIAIPVAASIKVIVDFTHPPEPPILPVREAARPPEMADPEEPPDNA